MGYRFIDEKGREQHLPDARAFGDAIRAGRIHAGTLVFHEGRRQWVRAEAFPEFLAAASLLSSTEGYWPLGAEPPIAEESVTAQPKGPTFESTSHAASHDTGPQTTEGPAAPDKPGPDVRVAATAPVEQRTRGSLIEWLPLLLVPVLSTIVEPGLQWPERVGFAVGTVMGAWILAWVALRWFKQRNILIPIGTSVLAVWLAIASVKDSSLQQKALDTQAERLRSNVDRLVNFDPANVSASPAPVTENEMERLLWATNQMFADLAQISERMADSYGVDTMALQDFLTREYVTHASRYPEVGEFFARFAAYIVDWQSVYADSALAVGRRRIREAGLRPILEDSFTAGVRHGIAANLDYWDALARFPAAGLAVHRFLVEHEPYIAIDANGEAYFVRDGDYDRFAVLADTYDTTLQVMAEAEMKWKDMMLSWADSVIALTGASP